MVVSIFDLWLGIVMAAVIIPFILITDVIFSVIVTFIFLKPILNVLQAAGKTMKTVSKRRLEHTKRWNFAGLILTVVSSTALYLHVIATFVKNCPLFDKSVLGDPFVLGIPMGSMLSILGMILLCGMFKAGSAAALFKASSKKPASEG